MLGEVVNMQFAQSQRGSSLLLALIFLIVMMLLGAAVVSISAGQLRVTISSEDMLKTFHATNAGVNRTLIKSVVRPSEFSGDYKDDLLLQFPDTLVMDNTAVGVTANQYGPALKYVYERRAKGSICPRASLNSGSSVLHIQCDHFLVESFQDQGSENTAPRIGRGVYREMLYLNSATHRELSLSD